MPLLKYHTDCIYHHEHYFMPKTIYLHTCGLAEQDTLIEYDQMRFIFPHSPQTSFIDFTILGSHWLKKSHQQQIWDTNFSANLLLYPDQNGIVLQFVTHTHTHTHTHIYN